MANKRIKDLAERTTFTSGDYIATDNNNGTRKVNASKIMTPISTAQSTADNVSTKVSNSGDAFSSSKGYSVGELCIYNNKVYRCKTAYSTGASWSSRSSNFEQVTLTDAITDLNNDLKNKASRKWTKFNPTATGTNSVDISNLEYEELFLRIYVQLGNEVFSFTTVTNYKFESQYNHSLFVGGGYASGGSGMATVRFNSTLKTITMASVYISGTSYLSTSYLEVWYR